MGLGVLSRGFRMLGVLFWNLGVRFKVECSGHGLPCLGWLWEEAATGDSPCNIFMCIIMNQVCICAYIIFGIRYDFVG